MDPHIPENYFKDDDVNQTPCLCWSSSEPSFSSNWVNYAVYQETPFDWRKIEDDASAYGYFIRGIMTYLDAFKSGNLVLPSALLLHFKELFPSSDDFLVWQFSICKIRQA